MKTTLILLILSVLFTASCSDQKAAEQRAKEEADAKARAEAARKEMDALPAAFKSPTFFKKNTPETTGTKSPTPSKPQPAQNNTK